MFFSKKIHMRRFVTFLSLLSIPFITAPIFAQTGTGELTFVEFEQDDADADGLNNPRSVTVSPDGNHVYVASRGDDSVTVFSRDGTSGKLTFVEFEQDGVGGVDGLDGATDVTVSPDGSHVYVVSLLDNSVAVFNRNGTSGELTFVEFEQDGVNGVNGLNKAGSVTASPDGSHIYVVSTFDNTLVVFSRDRISGELTFVEFEQDGVDGVDGLDTPQDLTVSPDGSHVYVVSVVDDSLVVFSRERTSGELTFVEFEQDGVNGVDGLHNPRGVTVSPDGDHVYVVSSLDDSVAVFNRDGISGELTFVEFEKDGVNGVDGLDTPQDVTVSPDGSHVYVVSRDDDSVAVFSRDGTSGELTFVEFEQDGVNGVDGLDDAYSVAVSPDRSHVYVVSIDDNSIAVFSRDVPEFITVPTLSEWGIITLVLCLGGAAFLRMRKMKIILAA